MERKEIITNQIQYLKGQMKNTEERIKFLSEQLNQEPDLSEVEPDKAPIKLPENKTHIIIDCGHGGMNPQTGVYVTAPSKMWKFEGKFEFHNQGDEFFEGVFNRAVGQELAKMLDAVGIPYIFVNHEWKDTKLPDRVLKANQYHRKVGKSVYLSIHGNASDNPKASGFSVFVSPNASKNSLKLATKLGEEVGKDLPEFTYRRQFADRRYWEAYFYVLRKTAMPAILSENGFFTNYEEAKKMMQPEFIKEIARQHFDTCIFAQTL